MAGTPTIGEFTYCRDCGGGLITWVEGRCISCDALATPVRDFDHLTLLAVAFLTTLANVGRRSGAVSEDDIAFAFHAASANATRSRIEPSQLDGDDDNAGLVAELGDQLRDYGSRIASNATALGYGDGLIAAALRAGAAGILRDVARKVGPDDVALGTGFGDCPRCGLEYVLTEEGRCIVCEVEESGLDVDSLLYAAAEPARAGTKSALQIIWQTIVKDHGPENHAGASLTTGRPPRVCTWCGGDFTGGRGDYHSDEHRRLARTIQAGSIPAAAMPQVRMQRPAHRLGGVCHLSDLRIPTRPSRTAHRGARAAGVHRGDTGQARDSERTRLRGVLRRPTWRKTTMTETTRSCIDCGEPIQYPESRCPDCYDDWLETPEGSADKL